MIITFYIAILFTIAIDETWNINHPRPNPKKIYRALQWEESDFYSQKINNEWVLRKYRETDSLLKKHVRKKYWKKRLKVIK